MGTLTADEFGTGAGTDDIGFSDLFDGKAGGDCHLPQMHPDECTADVNAGGSLHMFHHHRVGKGLVCSGGKAAACFRLRHYIHRCQTIGTGRFFFQDDGPVQMLTALAR